MASARIEPNLEVILSVTTVDAALGEAAPAGTHGPVKAPTARRETTLRTATTDGRRCARS